MTIGKLRARTAAELNQTTLVLLASAPLPVRTITADNGTEFHAYKDIEAQSTLASSSPPRTIPGNAVRLRTPTASSASTCPSAPVWPASLKTTAISSLNGSTPGPESASTTSLRRKPVTYSATEPCCTSKLILRGFR